jgi:hypothetical protein
MTYEKRDARCQCRWDCSHAWCGCSVHTSVVCICGVSKRDCPVHGPNALPKDRKPRAEP